MYQHVSPSLMASKLGNTMEVVGSNSLNCLFSFSLFLDRRTKQVLHQYYHIVSSRGFSVMCIQ